MGKLEDIILQHSCRGMDLLRPYMDDNFCMDAAYEILTWDRRTVFLTTGFYVAGHPETDGPLGTYALATALQALGFHPCLITDFYCAPLFSSADFPVLCVDLPKTSDSSKESQNYRQQFETMLKQYNPVGLISIERCGHTLQEDYCNMRGISIKQYTAPIDQLFELAANHFPNPIPTIGIGDGGNEIGMGNLYSQIQSLLSIQPSAVSVDNLVIATVSNWGAYGIAAALEILSEIPVLVSAQDLLRFFDATLALGSVDGILKVPARSVDGFDISIELSILEDLRSCTRIFDMV